MTCLVTVYTVHQTIKTTFKRANGLNPCLSLCLPVFFMYANLESFNSF